MRLVDEGLELLEEDECRSLLATTSIGRVGITVNGLPAILPVNYRLVGDDVVFATGPGLKLNAVRAGSVLAFEVDQIDESTRTGWSVLVIGVATELDQPVTQLRAAMDPWAGGDRSHLVRVKAELISGRRINVVPLD